MITRISDWLRSLGNEGAEPGVDTHPLVQVVELELDRPRRLRFTMAESAEFRRRTGVSILRDGVDLLDLEEDVFLELLATACRHEDPEVTADQLAPHVTGGKITDAVAALMVVLARFVPPTPEGADEDPLMAGALSHLTSRSTGRSRRRSSASPTGNSGSSPPD